MGCSSLTCSLLYAVGGKWEISMGYDSQPAEKLTLSNIAYQAHFPTLRRGGATEIRDCQRSQVSWHGARSARAGASWHPGRSVGRETRTDGHVEQHQSSKPLRISMWLATSHTPAPLGDRDSSGPAPYFQRDQKTPNISSYTFSGGRRAR
jgi:hypothetical protein